MIKLLLKINELNELDNKLYFMYLLICKIIFVIINYRWNSTQYMHHSYIRICCI